MFLLTAVLLFVTAAVRLSAQDTSAVDNNRLSAYLITYGPGDDLYSWFGHSEVLIENHTTGSSRVYDFGLFDYNHSNFMRNIIFGELWYKAYSTEWEKIVPYYQQFDRSVYRQKLALTTQQVLALEKELEWWMRPNNNTYRYRFFHNNCSTIIRDIFGKVLSNDFNDFLFTRKSTLTFRQLVTAHSGHSFFTYLFLMTLLGVMVDQPVTLWDELFIPDRMRLALEKYFIDGDSEQPLVSGAEDIYRSKNRQPAGSDSSPWPLALLFAFILVAFVSAGGALAGLKRGVWLKIYNIIAFLVHLPLLFMASLLFFAMFFSYHYETYVNINLLLLMPFLLFFQMSLNIAVLVGKNPVNRQRLLKILYISRIVAISLSVVAVIIRLMLIQQDNTIILLVVVPVQLAILFWDRTLFNIFREQVDRFVEPVERQSV